MILGKRILGGAIFSFDYFSNGGFIGFACIECKKDIKIEIVIYKSGILLEQLDSKPEFKSVLDRLSKLKIVSPYDKEKHKIWSVNSKYVLWGMDARYDIVNCNNCQKKHITIYGMAEIQPGREELQYKGLFELNED